MTTTIRLQREAFDVAAEVERMTRGRTDIGAVVTFTGLCRADENGEPIAALTLEHYPGMAEAEIARHVEEAQRALAAARRDGDPSLRAHRTRRGHRSGGDGIEPSRSGVRGGVVSDGLPEDPRAILEAGGDGRRTPPGSRPRGPMMPRPNAGRRRRPGGRRRSSYSAATWAGSVRSLGLSSQASSQLTTLSDLTNLPTPSTSAQNRPSSMISSSLKCLARSA